MGITHIHHSEERCQKPIGVLFLQAQQGIKQNKYPMPLICDILHRRRGYNFFKKIYISMQYYTSDLDEEAHDLYTIFTPFGKFKCLRLPMGIKFLPDIAQEIIEDFLRGLSNVDVYIDDIGIFSNSYDEDMCATEEVVRCLHENGFTINPLKCKWAV